MSPLFCPLTCLPFLLDIDHSLSICFDDCNYDENYFDKTSFIFLQLLNCWLIPFFIILEKARHLQQSRAHECRISRSFQKLQRIWLLHLPRRWHDSTRQEKFLRLPRHAETFGWLRSNLRLQVRVNCWNALQTYLYSFAFKYVMCALNHNPKLWIAVINELITFW